MTYAEMIAMPDHGSSSELENNEDGKLSTDGTVTPTPQSSKLINSSSASTVHNINVNYRHSYSVAKKNGEEIDIPLLLQSLSHHTSLQSPSTALIAAKATEETVSDPIKQKRCKLIMDNEAKPLIFTPLDIYDPPHLSFSNDMDGLVRDWEDSSYLIIKGVPVAMKYWSQVFRWARPIAWEVIKDNWSNWKVMSPIRFQLIRSFRVAIFLYLPQSHYIITGVNICSIALCLCRQVLQSDGGFLAQVF